MTDSPPDPIKALSCETCYYVMPSYSSSTGLRCGLKYFQASAFMRKLQRMENYPEVKKINACESWLNKST
ncbi:hypothetical protein LMORI2_09700 [Limnohabitans sp. MORI2]|jgi:hypothetical protein|uniref:hypothetical protein n=1 Tax=Limnohabitans sp. MORI2 TaxID=1751150 RepID=UPI002377064A|nr:hypothetical protein [Limnohabitans sp. MORI2]BDU57988.1 hypothetical protein LMORI2_09700 [Limnohabitans sp. MORI2]